MQSQIKDCNQKTDVPCSDAQQHTFLEASMQNVSQLANIKSTATSLDKHHPSGTKLTFEKCVSMLQTAAQEHDLKVSRVASKICCPSCSTRSTCMHGAGHDIVLSPPSFEQVCGANSHHHLALVTLVVPTFIIFWMTLALLFLLMHTSGTLTNSHNSIKVTYPSSCPGVA